MVMAADAGLAGALLLDLAAAGRLVEEDGKLLVTGSDPPSLTPALAAAWTAVADGEVHDAKHWVGKLAGPREADQGDGRGGPRGRWRLLDEQRHKPPSACSPARPATRRSIRHPNKSCARGCGPSSRWTAPSRTSAPLRCSACSSRSTSSKRLVVARRAQAGRLARQGGRRARPGRRRRPGRGPAAGQRRGGRPRRGRGGGRRRDGYRLTFVLQVPAGRDRRAAGRLVGDLELRVAEPSTCSESSTCS